MSEEKNSETVQNDLSISISKDNFVRLRIPKGVSYSRQYPRDWTEKQILADITETLEAAGIKIKHITPTSE